jgi:iron complex transport system substrate-binding protein
LIVLCGGLIFAGGKKEEEQQETASSGETASADEPSEVIEQPEAAEKPSWLVEETDTYITIIDSVGNQVKVDKPVRTTLANGMGELYATLRAIHAEDMIVASTEYTSRNTAFFPKISKLPSISSVDQLNNERILELNPDVIFCSPTFYAMFNDVMRSQFPIVQVAFETIEDIRIVGSVLGKSEEAEAYISWIEGYLDMIDRKVSALREDELRDVFIFYGGEYGMAPPPPYGTFGKDNSRTGQIRRAGGVSISRELEGEWISVDPEWIAEQDPPIIVREVYLTDDTPEMGYGIDDASRVDEMLSGILSQPVMEMTSAGKNNDVLMIYGDLFEDSWFVAIAYLAKFFHPQLFEDLDPIEMHQEFISRFQRIDFDVRTQGMFTYSAE